MIVDIWPVDGRGRVTVPASQFLVRDSGGNPIAVGAEYGPEGTQDVSVKRLPDFARTLTVLGADTLLTFDPDWRPDRGMTVEIVVRVGVHPSFFGASAFVVYQDNGTPIAAGAVFGDGREQTVTMVGLSDFHGTLRALGINTTVVVETLAMPKPQPGARLIAGPKE